MATQYIPARRGALYILTQTSDGTYLAPTQASDKALRVSDVSTMEFGGGVELVTDDVVPYGGGLLPFLGDTNFALKFSLRVPAWPGSRNFADFPAMAALLQCLPVAVSEAGTTLAVTPISSLLIGAAGTIKPVSIAFLETGGNVWTAQDVVGMIDEIKSDGNALIASFSLMGILRSKTDTVQTLSDASLTIADVAYTATTPIPSRAGTLTLTGGTGTGVFAMRSFSQAFGQTLDAQGDRLATFGNAIAAPQNRANAALSMTVTELDASSSGRDWVEDLLNETTFSAATVVYGSGASRFALGLGTQIRVSEVKRGADANVVTLDIVLVGSPTAAGNDQYSITWGA